MPVSVHTFERVTASSGRIRVDELEVPFLFKVTLAGLTSPHLDDFTATLEELRDLFDVLGDLITFIDTAQPDAIAS